MEKQANSPNEELEERIVGLLSDMMGMINIAKQGKLKGILGYELYMNAETEFLTFLANPKLDSSRKRSYEASYEGIKLIAGELDAKYPLKRKIRSEPIIESNGYCGKKTVGTGRSSRDPVKTNLRLRYLEGGFF